jgi:hypothetical protein
MNDLSKETGDAGKHVQITSPSFYSGYKTIAYSRSVM